MRGRLLSLSLTLSACAPASSWPRLTIAAQHTDVRIELRSTPDEADTRHQLYVHWLNAHATDPDVLQLDVIWTPECAAAGW